MACLHGMPPKSLVEICRHNISVKILAIMGAIHIWKELAMQAKEVDEISQRLEADERENLKEIIWKYLNYPGLIICDILLKMSTSLLSFKDEHTITYSFS